MVVEPHAFLTLTLDGDEPIFEVQSLCLATRAEGSMYIAFDLGAHDTVHT